ncbi:serine hydrolase domain-containing protein [Streptomyces profundus]|uniref:serine hydrolase domain-containing protein n=1 Tax=Streptomyces profundus TaxID=2867410 RepID=UPI001D16A10E|nr:serine hydrolase domain-containing protein [Streptomyces sp. MA3_2.13]UED83527.1 beta-lactamase family protein [Streptomyces sp. MA3_2.13]
MATETPEVSGVATAAFEPLRAEFAAVLDADPGHAAQLAVHLHGRLVVDLWGGPDIQGDSLTGVFSSTKGIAFLVAALLVRRGQLDVTREVRSYWPEFAAEGKGGISVHDLLAHRAGSIGTEDGFTREELADDAAIADRLAGHHPYWHPGRAFGYHSLTVGALTGEIVRRITGRSLRALYDEEIRGPLGVDFHLGLPEAEERRLRTILPAPPGEPGASEPAGPPDGIAGIAGNRHRGDAPTVLHELPNSRRFRAGGQSSAGGVASARGLSRLYAAAVTGVDGAEPLLDEATARLCGLPYSVGHDLVLDMRRAYGLGFMVGFPHLPAGTFGHDGAGGSVALASPSTGLAFGYTRRVFAGGSAPEADRLAAVAHACALRAG